MYVLSPYYMHSEKCETRKTCLACCVIFSLYRMENARAKKLKLNSFTSEHFEVKWNIKEIFSDVQLMYNMFQFGTIFATFLRIIGLFFSLIIYYIFFEFATLSNIQIIFRITYFLKYLIQSKFDRLFWKLLL